MKEHQDKGLCCWEEEEKIKICEENINPCYNKNNEATRKTIINCKKNE